MVTINPGATADIGIVQVTDKGVTIQGDPNTPGTDSLTTTNTIGGDFNPERVQIQVDTGVTPGLSAPVTNPGAVLNDVTGIVCFFNNGNSVTAVKTCEQGNAQANSKWYKRGDDGLLSVTPTFGSRIVLASGGRLATGILEGDGLLDADQPTELTFEFTDVRTLSPDDAGLYVGPGNGAVSSLPLGAASPVAAWPPPQVCAGRAESRASVPTRYRRSRKP